MHLKEQEPRLRRTPDWLIGLVLGAILVTVLFSVLGAVGAGDDPSFQTGDGAPLVEGPASDTAGLEFTLYDGTTATFADFEGPIVVNFWASWCPACVVELPDFAQVSREFVGDVTFIGMNVLPDDRAAAEALIAQTGVEYQLAEDDAGSLFTEFGGIAMPTTVFIDGRGNVVEVHSGTIFAEDLRQALEELFGV